MLKLSFIIPTYNTGKLLGKCLESIVEQSESEVETEIIVVDDGSTDNTNEIISKYKESVRYIKKENSGVSDARNVGIKEAHGDYLCFVDSDDYISPYLCASVTESLQTKADIIYFGYCEGCQSNYQFENVPTTKMSDSLIAYGGAQYSIY